MNKILNKVIKNKSQGEFCPHVLIGAEFHIWSLLATSLPSRDCVKMDGQRKHLGETDESKKCWWKGELNWFKGPV